jgi:hypothetical protein
MYGSMTPLLTEFLKPDLIAKMASGAGFLMSPARRKPSLQQCPRSSQGSPTSPRNPMEAGR